MANLSGTEQISKSEHDPAEDEDDPSDQTDDDIEDVPNDEPFKLTAKQVEANKLLSGPAKHILLRGGSRSGKTFILMRAVIIRAMKSSGSTHAVLRFRFNHLKESIINDTLPKVMALCWPEIPYETNKTDWYTRFPNDARILYGGLDDKERTEKILGQEHSTILLNECSQISYASRNKAVTRLAQKSGLALKAYYDCNPPPVTHWTYQMFARGLEPTSGQPLFNPDAYTTMRMNPTDNVENLPEDYIDMLRALPARERRRFLEGEFLSEVPGALWTMENLEKGRRELAVVPPLERIVIAVDPSGCSGEEDERSDEVGIMAVGRGIDKHGYLLEDASGRYSPAEWAKKAIELYDLWNADCIVAEKNYGGAMVMSTIKSARQNAKVKVVHATRGKVQRAEPVSSLYEQGLVHHIGFFPELEDQMLSFSTSGYQGSKSPDRADALVWGFSELLLSLKTQLSFASL